MFGKHVGCNNILFRKEYVKLSPEKRIFGLNIYSFLPTDKTICYFASNDVINNLASKIMVLIHGSGAVKAGQWSRSIIINHSLREGSQIPYIEMARELGFELLILNLNEDAHVMVRAQRLAVVSLILLL